MSYDKLLDKVYQFEKDNNLLNYEIDNIKIWQYLRATIFSEIYAQIAKNKQTTLSFGSSIKQQTKAKDIFKVLVNSILFNPLFSFKIFKGVDDIFMLSSRKYLHNGNYEDIYLYDIYNKSKNKLMLDNGNDINIFYKRIDWIIFAKLFLQKTFYRTNLNKKDLEYIIELENKLKKVLGFKVELKERFTKYLGVYKSLYLLNKVLFKLYRPKRCYLTASYGKAPTIKVAKDLGIEVIEVQHGILGKMHYGYYFPFDKNLDYFPSKFLVFGQYFKNLNYLPLSVDDIDIHHYSFLKAKKLEFNNEIQKNNLLIVSDAFVNGTSYLDFLVKNIDFIKTFDKVYYKLHPQETKVGFYDKIPQMQRLVQLGNFELIQPEKHIYKYLSLSKHVITVRSTVIYEALEFACNVHVVKEDGYEDMLDLKEYLSFVDLDEKISFETKHKSEKRFFIDSLKTNG